MLARLGADEYAEQLAYERIEPMDDGWIQSAKLICFVANSLGAKPQWKMEDCYPHLQSGKREQTPEEMASLMMTVMGVQNAYVARQRNRAT